MNKIFTKKLGTKSFFALLVAIAVCVCLVLNVFFTLLDAKIGLDVDMSAKENFQLCENSKELVKSVGIPVEINVLATKETFESNSNYHAQVVYLLNEMSNSNSNITVNYIDYVKNPSFTSRYPEFTLKLGDIIIESEHRNTQIATEDLFLYVTDNTGNIVIASSQAESVLIAGISKVTTDKLPLVLVTTGHGEVDISAFTNSLVDNGYQVENCSIMTEGIDSEAEVLMIATPKTDFSYEEIQIIENFMKNDGKYGKNIIFLDSANYPVLDNVSLLLEKYGIEQFDGAVFETDATRVYNSQPFYAVTDLLESDYKDSMINSKRPMLMPIARPMDAIFAVKGNYVVKTIAEFASSVGVQPSDADASFTADNSTMNGPFPSILQSTYTSANGESSNLIAISGVQSLVINSESYANTEFYLKLFANLCEKDSEIIILPKSLSGEALNITESQADMVFVIFVIALPVIILFAGVFVFIKRKNL